MSYALSYKVIDAFFDRPAVQNAVDKATRKGLSKAGAFVRQAARSSIRKRKRSAAPGQPPSSHAGDLKKGIVFAYDAGRRSVVVGPLAYNTDGGLVPSVLEFGGSLRKVFREREDGTLSRRRRRRVVQVWKFHPHPYMGPALEAEAPKFPDLWANQFKASA